MTRHGRELYIGITDRSWYDFLASRPQIDEVNFWRPGGRGNLQAAPGAPFAFKLHSPDNAIAGLGFFEYAERMSIGDAWEFYGEKNGAPTIDAMIQAIARYAKTAVDRSHQIGCTIISQPVFFKPGTWIEPPPDWKKSTVQGVYYDMDAGEGALLWQAMEHLIGDRLPPLAASALQPFGGRARSAIYLPRQGQGTFRRLVLSAYGNRCAITGEKTLPVVEAAHIKEFSALNRHEITNGVALRSDIHKLFDRGYVSIRPDYTFAVGKALAEEFHNGKIYYALDGQSIRLPENPLLQPDRKKLEEHYARLRN